MSNIEAKKESFNQKLARKNGWLTKFAFVAIAIVAVITLTHGHY